MRLILMGYKDHGKDTACEILRERFGLDFVSSSEMANNLFLYKKLKDEMGYRSLAECFSDRINHRERWYQEICDFNTDDRARMGREIFSRFPVYCGIRDLEELQSIKAAGMVDLIVWIDADERKPPESIKSMNISREHADVILNNNGTEQDLIHQVTLLYEQHILPLMEKPILGVQVVSEAGPTQWM